MRFARVRCMGRVAELALSGGRDSCFYSRLGALGDGGGELGKKSIRGLRALLGGEALFHVHAGAE
jgi:hypothetical protein